MESVGQIKTPPYLFFSSRQVGTTLAMKTADGAGVVGADILLAALNEGLGRVSPGSGSKIALVDGQGQVIAHHDPGRAAVPAGYDAASGLKNLDGAGLAVMAQTVLDTGLVPPAAGISRQILFAGEKWRVSLSPVTLAGGQALTLILATPERELLAAAFALRRSTVYATLAIILLVLPCGLLLARGVASPLRKLAEQGEAIRQFDFSDRPMVHSLVNEVHALAAIMEMMKTTIRRFQNLGAVVARETDFDRLLPILLSETIFGSDSEGGVLYLTDGAVLTPSVLRQRDGIRLNSSLPAVPLSGPGPLLAAALAGEKPEAARLAREDIDATGLSGVVSLLGAEYGLAVPLRNRQDQLVGALLLLQKAMVDETRLSFFAAFSAQAASALETRELIKSQKELFEAFIKLTAGAIDAKSAYTGGHCSRVPVLTEMLAQAACAETEGAYKDFSLNGKGWEALHIAAWLHDCGKLTTPEYVVDKATKLETIYDRIHEIRTRFEVLKRDAEIAFLKAVAGGKGEAEAKEGLAAELARLDDDFAFVAACNEGGEFLDPAKLERLQRIGSHTWLRTLDDRLGLSREELRRKEGTPPSPLPTMERLLADRPEHLLPRGPHDRLAEDATLGFRLPQPELLYNRGELYNLSVGRGTLSEEERYKINEHVAQTLAMLTQLPFPKHLRRVAEVASGHHEKLDGTGYPRQLTGEQICPVARMMAIADIFEALTAADRPYKKGKTLSEALRIMSFMVKDQHLDPELFELFVRSGTAGKYAAQYLHPEQID